MLHWLSRFSVMIPYSPSEKTFSVATERAHLRILSLAGMTFVLLPFFSVLSCTLI
jgi:hypothetical protein